MGKKKFVKQNCKGGGRAAIQLSGECSHLILYFLKAVPEEEAGRHGLKSSELGIDKNMETHGQHSTTHPPPRTSAFLPAASDLDCPTLSPG